MMSCARGGEVDKRVEFGSVGVSVQLHGITAPIGCGISGAKEYPMNPRWCRIPTM
jgi:hypothetical protein